MAKSAHLDTFAADRLPPEDELPRFEFLLPALRYPERINAATYFLDRHVVEGRGERLCAIAEDGTAYTYREMMEWANRIAHVLVNRLGLIPGNRVVLRSANTPTLIAAWFAVLKAGGIVVTTMPLYRSQELQTVIERAQISIALCDVRLAEDMERARSAYPGLKLCYWGSGEDASLERLAAAESTAFANVATATEDVAMIAFTSGTTGAPKAAMHVHRDLLATCDTFGSEVLRADPDDRFSGSPPLAFTYGLGGILLFPFAIGAATVLLERAGTEELAAAIERHRISVLFTAPLAYRALSAHAANRDWSSLRICVSAGETLPSVVWEAWRAATGISIIDGIGSTEMLHIFIASPAAEARPGKTGRVVPGYVAEIHDESGNPLPAGSVGRLAVRGPTGCRYLHDERQRTYVRSGWNYPGDAYCVDEEGVFTYVARADDMIVSAGYNVSGPEVEQVLLLHPDVAECAVVGKPDIEHHTTMVKAYVVLRTPRVADEDCAFELIAHCKATVASFKAPREIEFLDSLPRTATGKLQRYKLRERT